MTDSAPRSRRPVTGRPPIAQVAKVAGVSLGTVSNVLNHPDRVTERTREKVQSAMDELGYQRSAAARTLASGTSTAIGLVLTDLGNSLFVDIARGASRAAEAEGMNVLLADGESDPSRELAQLKAFDDLHVAGSMVTLSDEEHVAALVASRPTAQPLVLLNSTAPADRYCSIAVDHRLGGRLATEYLLSCGRRNLAFIGGPEGLLPIEQRREGFRDALAAAGLTSVREVDPLMINRADGALAAQDLLAEVRAGTVDGIFAASDLMAAGLIDVFVREGVAVPDDVAIVGYDDNVAARDVPVSLTTVAQPGALMGSEGTRLVLSEAKARASADEPGATEHVHETVVLQPELVVRDSTP